MKTRKEMKQTVRATRLRRPKTTLTGLSPNNRHVAAAVAGCIVGGAALLHPAGAAAAPATPFAVAEGNNNAPYYFDNLSQYSTAGTVTAAYLSYSPLTSTPAATASGALATAGFPITTSPQSVAYDSSGDLFVSGNTSNSIYEVSPGGVASQFGSGQAEALDMAIDPVNGNLYLEYAGSIQAFNTSTGAPVGSPITVSTIDSAAALKGMAFDSSGDLYVTDGHASNLEIIKLANSGTTPTGTQNIFATNYSGTSFLNPHGVAVDSAGNVYLADSASGSSDGAIYEFASDGSTISSDTHFGTAGTGGQRYSPYGLEIDANGNLFMSVQDTPGRPFIDEVTTPLIGANTGVTDIVSSVANGNNVFNYFAFDNAVPEPSPSSLCLLGLGGLGLLARRRRA